jgi:alpha-tubulin suppressor-like RCC1 family protein
MCAAGTLAFLCACGRVGFAIDASAPGPADGGTSDRASPPLDARLDAPAAIDGSPIPSLCGDGGAGSPPPCAPHTIDRVTSGFGHVCAIDDGALHCWGLNLNRALGICAVGAAVTRPEHVGIGYADVSCGEYHTCGVRTDGTLHCWGSNYEGESGQDTGGADVPTPTRVGMLDDWLDVEARRYSACALRSPGSLHCWGRNDNAELGLGTVGPDEGIYEPREVHPGPGFIQIAMGSAHGCALRDDSTIWCWGLNDRGEVGVGDTTMHTTPVRLGDNDWLEVRAGKEHTCARKNDGTVWCWGQNDSGQLGVGDQIDRTIPTLVSGGMSWAQLGLGWFHTCAIRDDGTLFCWGYGERGQVLGLAAGMTRSHVPLPQDVGGRTWRSVVGGDAHTCALAADGSLWCWGDNANGVLGVGDTEPRASAAEVCFP